MHHLFIDEALKRCGEDSLPEVTAALRSDFAPTGTLRIGLNMRNSLLTRIDASTGKPAGVAHDLAQELAGRLGLSVVMCPYPNPGELADAASRSEWDICFLAAEPQRAEEIDFTAAYVEIDATYLVPAGSTLRLAEEVDAEGMRITAPNGAAFELYLTLRLAEEVDAEGMRITAPNGAAFELYLTRTLKYAVLSRESGADASFERFVNEEFDALAGLRPRLTTDQAKLVGSRVLKDRFTAVQQAAGVPKGRPGAARYLNAFIEDVGNSGLVEQAIKENNVVGLTIVTRTERGAHVAGQRA